LPPSSVLFLAASSACGELQANLFWLTVARACEFEGSTMLTSNAYVVGLCISWAQTLYEALPCLYVQRKGISSFLTGSELPKCVHQTIDPTIFAGNVWQMPQGTSLSKSSSQEPMHTVKKSVMLAHMSVYGCTHASYHTCLDVQP